MASAITGSQPLALVTHLRKSGLLSIERELVMAALPMTSWLMDSVRPMFSKGMGFLGRVDLLSGSGGVRLANQ